MDINKNIKGINSNIKELNNNITNTVRSKLPLQLQYILGVYFLGLFFMLMYRFANFAIHCFISFSDINIVLLLRSLLVGIRFDTVVMCWMLAPFSVLMVLATLSRFNKKWFYRPVHILLCFIFAVAYFIIAIDVAYFIYFRSHIHIIVLSWLQSPKYMGALFLRHPIYLLYLAAFLFSLAWYLWLMYCLYNVTLFKTTPPYKQEYKTGKSIVFSLVILLLCAVGMHGRITSARPLGITSAYFSDSDFFNQLGINPLFNLAKSIEEENQKTFNTLTVVDGLTAKKVIEEEFILKNDRPASLPELPTATNVVMIIMDEVGLDDVSYNKMPYLKSVATKGISFTDVYPDGINGYNGIFSILFAYPNILSDNSMNTTIVPKLNGISNVLQQNNYRNIFFAAEKQNDNILSRFLYRNDFNTIVTEENSKISDKIAKISGQAENFFACVLINKNEEKHPLKATDNYIKDFINKAKSTPWFKSTLFVITSAKAEDKIPLIMYMPSALKPAQNNNLASQTDITPTVLAMIDRNYINEETLGLNIFSDIRSYAVTSYPHKIIVRNDTWKYVWRDNGYESLYYKDSDKQGVNYILTDRERAEEMKTYAFSMLQTTQYRMSQYRLSRK